MNKLTCNLCKVTKKWSPPHSLVSQWAKYVTRRTHSSKQSSGNFWKLIHTKAWLLFLWLWWCCWGLCPVNEGKSLGVLAKDSLLPSKGCGRLIRWWAQSPRLRERKSLQPPLNSSYVYVFFELVIRLSLSLSLSWRENKAGGVELKSHLQLNFETEEICNVGKAGSRKSTSE